MRIWLIWLCAVATSAPVCAQLSHSPGVFIHAPGGKIWRETEGRGPPLVLIAGGPGLSHAYLHNWFSPLADRNRLVYFDAIGTGRSSRHAFPYTFAEAIEGIEALRRSLGIHTVNLLGHSYGGTVALGSAKKYPNRVGKLIIANMVASGAEQQLIQDGLNETFRRHSPEAWAKLSALRAAGAKSSSPAHQEAYQPPARMLNFYNPDNAARMPRGEPNFYNSELWYSMAGEDADFIMSGELRDFDARRVVRSLRMPILVLAGRYDRLVYPELMSRWRSYAPKANVYFLEKSGHFPFLEQPVETAALISTFLAAPRR